jgi:hypothetical protein
MNYKAHDDVTLKAAEHLAKILAASEIAINTEIDNTNNDFYCAFTALYWRNYITLGLCNKSAVYYKTRELVEEMQCQKQSNLKL